MCYLFRGGQFGPESPGQFPAESLVSLQRNGVVNFNGISNKPADYIFPFLKNNLDYSDPTVLFNAISSNTACANKNLKMIGAKAGIEKHISFHSSRHTFATRALKKGMRIEYVSKLLGHTNLKTTQIYAKIVNEELDKAMDVFN